MAEKKAFITIFQEPNSCLPNTPAQTTKSNAKETQINETMLLAGASETSESVMRLLIDDEQQRFDHKHSSNIDIDHSYSFISHSRRNRDLG